MEEIATIEQDELLGLTPQNTIRTETVLSRLPIHSLSTNRSGEIKIRITNEAGNSTLVWEVTHSNKYGDAGPQAFRLEKMVVNKHIDRHRPFQGSPGQELPRIIRIGSLNDVCRELGLKPGGRTKKQIKTAFRQNAGAQINAFLTYTDRKGVVRTLEDYFTRYSVRFSGQQLPTGEKSDAIYIILNDTYWNVLNSARFRPLDYDYLKELPPSSQRFYELVSYQIYSALLNNKKEAQMRYSEYCQFAPQVRHFTSDQVSRQMKPIHDIHKQSEYLKSTRMKKTVDGEGQPDWIMYYAPGKRAVAQYRAYKNQKEIPTNGREAISSLSLLPEPPVNDGAGNEPVMKTVRGTVLKKNFQSQKNHRQAGEITNSAQLNFLNDNPTELAPETSEAEKLVVLFFSGLKNAYREKPFSKELEQAAGLIAQYGIERAEFIVSYTLRKAPESNFQIRSFGATSVYVEQALRDFESLKSKLGSNGGGEQQAADSASVKASLTELEQEEQRLQSEYEMIRSLPEAEQENFKKHAVKKVYESLLPSSQAVFEEHMYEGAIRKIICDQYRQKVLDLWQQALNRLRDTIGRQAVTSWLSPAAVIAARFEGQKIYLQPKNQVVAEWVKENYEDGIRAALKDITHFEGEWEVIWLNISSPMPT